LQRGLFFNAVDENDAPSSPRPSSPRQVQVGCSTSSEKRTPPSRFDSADYPSEWRNMNVQNRSITKSSARALLPKLNAAGDACWKGWFREHPAYKKFNDLVDLEASHPFHGLNGDILMK
jgi:hypothetical protein